MYTIKDNDLIIDTGKHAVMPHAIKQCIECCNLLVVLLKVPPEASMTENIFGVNHDGEVVWQIEKIPETSIHPQLWYASMMLTEMEVIRAGNWNGWVVDVDPRTGKVGARTWSK